MEWLSMNLIGPSVNQSRKQGQEVLVAICDDVILLYKALVSGNKGVTKMYTFEDHGEKLQLYVVLTSKD